MVRKYTQHQSGPESKAIPEPSVLAPENRAKNLAIAMKQVQRLYGKGKTKSVSLDDWKGGSQPLLKKEEDKKKNEEIVNEGECRGSYTAPIRIHPVTKAGECKNCGRRYDAKDLAGSAKNIPIHSPNFGVQKEEVVNETLAGPGHPDLKKLKRQYDRNEDNNDHSTNAVLLAKHFGTEAEHNTAKQHLANRNRLNHGSEEGSKFQYDMSKKYYKRLTVGPMKMKEETTKKEIIAELSKKTLSNYIKKATKVYGDGTITNLRDMSRGANKFADQAARKGDHEDADYWDDKSDKHQNKANKRSKFVGKAVDKLANVGDLTKEEVMNELSKRTLVNYVKKASKEVDSNAWSSGFLFAHEPHENHRSVQYSKKIGKRTKGIGNAADKLAGSAYKLAPQVSCHGGVCEVVSSMDEIKPILKEYNKDAVDKAIASSNRSGKRIGGKEAKLIHKLLSSGSVAKMNPRTNFRGDDNKVVKEDLIFEAGKKTKNSKDAMKRRYLGNLRGTTATGKPAHAIITTPTADNYKSR